MTNNKETSFAELARTSSPRMEVLLASPNHKNENILEYVCIDAKHPACDIFLTG